eukprot:PITA_12518
MQEFGSQRDRIAETPYASARCCESVRLAEPHDHKIIIDDHHDKVHYKEENSDSYSTGNRCSSYSYEAQEDLIGEVFRIKDILAANPGDEEDTQIGRQVNRLRKHSSKEIQSMVKRLNSAWKNVADEWAETTGCTSLDSISISPASVNDGRNGLPSPPLDEWADGLNGLPSPPLDEWADGLNGLPSPPLDEWAFANQMTSNPHAAEKIKISEYDDHYVEKTKISEYDDHYDVGQNQHTANEIQQSAHHSNLKRDSSPHVKQTTNKERGKFKRNIQIQAVTYCQGHKMSHSNSIADRFDVGIPPIISSSSKHKGNPENVLKHPDLDTNQTKPDSFTVQNESKSPDDTSFKVKLEAAKKRLREGYQKVENAKKQRRVQAIQLQDLPKHGAQRFRATPVPRHHRQWLNKPIW